MSEEDILIRISNAEMMGRVAERERIIKAVINNSTQLADLYKLGLVEKAEALLSALIKGEQDSDACEPADLPCINGFSCKKHGMSFEQAMQFAKGEQK